VERARLATEDETTREDGFKRWFSCDMCHQDFHGTVSLALASACWNTYVRWAEGDYKRLRALGNLGGALHQMELLDEAELAIEKTLALFLRHHPRDNGALLSGMGNLANMRSQRGRHQEALGLRRLVYQGYSESFPAALGTFQAASNLGVALCQMLQFDEARNLLRGQLAAARKALGPNHEIVLMLAGNLAVALSDSRSDAVREPTHLMEAEGLLEGAIRTARRVLGAEHPHTRLLQRQLSQVQSMLAAAG